MGLNKLLAQNEEESHGLRRAMRKQRRRDRLERAARRKSRGRPAGDSLGGLYGRGGVEGSESTKKCQAHGVRPLNISRSDLGEAAQETANGRPDGRKRSPARRGDAFHPRWDV